MLDELMFYPILKSRSHYKKYYLSNLLCKDTIFFITTIITGKKQYNLAQAMYLIQQNIA